MELEEFNQKLNECDESEIVDFTRKNILHGIPYVFSSNEDNYYDFRKRIANKFEVLYHDIYITGSSKLGFSPHKQKEFDYDSDIDVAIVSSKLFYKIMEDIYSFQMELRSSRKTISTKELKMYHTFLEYVAIGWIRPDKLPISFQVDKLKNDWFEYFDSISYGKSEVGNYKIAAGVFKNYNYLERYIIDGLRSIKLLNSVGE